MDKPKNGRPPLRLLLVEDNKHDVLAFKRTFKDSGVAHHITHFPRAETALKRLTRDANDFDLVICDYNLPGMSGFELCKSLLAQNIDLPLVLLTGDGAETLAVDAIKAGVNDYIVKDPNQGYLSLLPVVLPEVVRQFQDRRARERIERILAKRERYLAALVDVQQILLGFDDQEIHYDQILSLLGDTAQARRAYIFENYWDANDCLVSRRTAVWFASQDETEPVAPLLAEINFNTALTRWATMLDQEQPVTGITASFPEDEQELLVAQNVGAVLMLPITVNGEFFGFIGFDTDQNGRAWEWGEVDLLYAAAAAISMWQERRYAEEQLREYTIKLQAHNEELDAFAHTVAHDLKNPLSALTGIAEVLAVEYANEELSEYLRVIVRSGRKANNIVKELLLLASVRKQEEIALTPLNMDKIVAETWERLLHLLKQHHAEFIVPTAWPTALGYAPWIEEVWSNYMSNGLKYGGEPPRLELGAEEQTDGQVRFWIRDNGPGLQPEEQATLFTPFTKLKQARAKGQGLGLSIVRRIIERLGGTVGVESNPEVEPGSTFYFTLPKADPAIDPAEINS